MSSLLINISNLAEGVHSYSLETEPSDIELDERFNNPVTVTATVSKTINQIHLVVELTTGGSFECDRCLDEFHLPVRGSYTMVYVTDSRSAEDTSDEFEVQVLKPDTNIIDLGEDVRQFTMLAVPQKLLCKEDCAGLCPKCGTNFNYATCNCGKEETDSRWDALKKLKSTD